MGLEQKINYQRNKLTPLISVIIPVYNMEKYLKRCVDSVLEQTYKHMEIILVNDGSTDRSLEICKEFIKKNKNIQLIDKENKGLSSARNAGIQAACGEYIGFVDSDDCIHKEMYAYLTRLIFKYDADVAQIEYDKFFGIEKPNQENKKRYKIKVYKDKSILQYYMDYTTKSGSYSVARCLFKKEVLEGLRFREGKINEDIDFKYAALARSSKIAVSDRKMYYYFQSGNSLSSAGLKKQDFDLYEAAAELLKLTQNEEFGTIRFLGEVKRARTAFSLLSKTAYYGFADSSLNQEKIIRRLVVEHRENLKILLKSPITLGRKVLCIAFALDYQCGKFIVQIGKRIKAI